MKTYEFNDDEVAVILNALYPRYDDLETTLNNVTNPILIASLKSEFNELKSLIKKFEED